MRTRRRAPLVFAFSLLCTMAPPVQAGDAPKAAATGKQPDAVLAMAAGPVVVRRGGERLTAAFGTQLRAGDLVETGPGAQAGVLFASGQIVEIGPASRITIGSLPAKPSGGRGEDASPSVPGALAGQLTRFSQAATGEAGLSALPALRSAAGGEPHLEAVTPRRTLVRPGAVRFEWTPVDGALEYKVELAGPGRAQGSHRATGTTWTPAADAGFAPGESWTWSVEAMTAEGPVRSETYVFEVAPEPVVRELEALRGELQPFLTSSSEPRLDLARYLVASFCRTAGLFGDAATELEALVARYPDRAELHRDLGFVYQAMGRFDKAAEEYRLALKG